MRPILSMIIFVFLIAALIYFGAAWEEQERKILEPVCKAPNCVYHEKQTWD